MTDARQSVTDETDGAHARGPSPLSAEALAAGRISLYGLQATEHALWWVESRPTEGGLRVLVRLDHTDPDHGHDVSGSGSEVPPRRDEVPGEPNEVRREPVEVLPKGTGVSSSVHEYGGGAFFVSSDGLVFTGQRDQALWWVDARDLAGRGEGPETVRPARLTPAAPDGEEHRYADARPIPGTSLIVALRERHHTDAVEDELVVVDVDTSGRDPDSAPGPDPWPEAVVSGRDFVASPRPSPDGRRIAWVTWDLPNMPWDGCELWVGDVVVANRDGPHSGPVVRVSVADAHLVAGGPTESVGQPTWLDDERLLFVSDRADYWQPYVVRLGAGESRSAARRLTDEPSDFHAPDWSLGQQTIALLHPVSAGRSAPARRPAPLPGDRGSEPAVTFACRVKTASSDVVCIVGDDGTVRELDQPCVAIRTVTSDGSDVFVSGSTPTDAAVVVAVSAHGRPGARLVATRAPRPTQLDKTSISTAHPIRFATRTVEVDGQSDGPVIAEPAQLYFYPPCGVTDVLPPVIVQCHGGPTGSWEVGFDPSVQFWTTRGFAFVAVDYRGSSGYGRAFRTMINGRWGVVDAEDCVSALEHLVDEGLVDPERALVRGTSSGGMTALLALTNTGLTRGASRAGESGRPGDKTGLFKGAMVTSGVTDLRSLARDTHKFESGYLETIVGARPQAHTQAHTQPRTHLRTHHETDDDVYVRRSPLSRAREMSGSVLLLHGDADAVVPPSQAEQMAAELRRHGVACRLVFFRGEGHGFRRADSLAAAATAELEFAVETLGLGSTPTGCDLA